jgi:hypothetical protein
MRPSVLVGHTVHALRGPRPVVTGLLLRALSLRDEVRILLLLAFAVATAGVITAIALPSIDPCRVGDQVLPGCIFLTPRFDRIGLRLTIGGVGLLLGASVFLWARRMGSD